jgi:GNAT superfamily N-acetyltransferase
MQVDIDGSIRADEFIALSKACGWGVHKPWDLEQVERALGRTTNFVVRDEQQRLIGCGRVLSDRLLVTTVADIFVHPDHRMQGIGRAIMEAIKQEFADTSIYFGSQPDVEGFYEKLGFERGMTLFQGRFSRSE